jgi:hypothetical protein
VRDGRERVQVRAAVRVHHAFRSSGRAARVVDRDRVELVFEPPFGLGVAGAVDELVVVAVAALATDEHALDRRVRHEVTQRLVHDEHPRAGVPEDVVDLLGMQPGVDRDEHAACPGQAKVRLEKLGHIRRQEGDALAMPQPPLLERKREAPRALSRLRPCEATLTVDNRHTIAVDIRRPFEERDRRQLRDVDLIAHAATNSATRANRSSSDGMSPCG